MESKIITISGCIDCPMCDMNDMSSGYSCKMIEYPNNDSYIKEDNKKHIPITPKWCPIKQSDITFKFKNG